MRTLTLTIAAFAVGLGATAHAQVLFPFEPEQPDYGKRPQCTSEYVRSLERQAAAIKELRASSGEAVSRLCGMIEGGSDWLGKSLPDDARRKLGALLGVDDLDKIGAQCRVGQDSLERELMSKLAHLKSELLRCDDTI